MGEADRCTWQEALDAANVLNRRHFGYASSRDWQVPTIDELKTLKDPSAFPTINQLAFPNTSPQWYWSSSDAYYAPNGALVVNFYYGGVYAGNKADGAHVRLVRGGQ